MMDETAFRAELAQQGYADPVEVVRDANLATTEHTHEHSVSALIIDGEISVITADGTTTCRSGDTFTLASGVPHYERYGAQGARILTGKRIP